MLNKVLETIKHENMLKAGDRVVCAVSGGADSMALLCALYELKDTLQIEIFAANVNHSIRGEESDSDSQFVKDFCHEKGIELFYQKVDIPAIAKKAHIGEEECGRIERYRFFNEISQSLGGAIIATGHHRTDSVETVLFNLFRGSGAGGIKGISPKRDNIIRPLINVSGKETKKYLTEKGILWREDSTNKDCVYTRNKIRHVIMPQIEKMFIKAEKKIAAAAEAIKTDDEYLSYLATESGALEKGVIYKDKFVKLHEALRRRIIISALKEWGAEVNGESIKAVYETVMNTTGKCRDVGSGVRIENIYGKIVKCEKKASEKNEAEYKIKIGEDTLMTAFDGNWSIKVVDKLPKMRDNKMMIFFDADIMGAEISIRCRREGDYMHLKGLSGRKKLKKIFIDLKIPKEIRDKIALVAIGDEVLFVPGVRKSSSYMPNEHTKRFCVIEYAEASEG